MKDEKKKPEKRKAPNKPSKSKLSDEDISKIAEEVAAKLQEKFAPMVVSLDEDCTDGYTCLIYHTCENGFLCAPRFFCLLYFLCEDGDFSCPIWHRCSNAYEFRSLE